MFYSPDIVSEVTALNDVLSVISPYVPSLRSRSGSYFGLCPFHNEKTPSFSVNQDKQIFYCFGCGAGGNVVSFIMKIENINFPDALKLLAHRANFNLPEEGRNYAKQAAKRELTAELNKKAARFYHNHLYSESPDAEKAREYLIGRGVDPKLSKRFGLGLSPPAWDGLVTYLNETQNLVTAGLATQGKKDAAKYFDRFRSRLMFPIIDSRNRVVGFGGRIMTDTKDEAKYINTAETSLFSKSNQLYGLHIARKTHAKEIIVVEGYMDVLAMHQAGFINTVGVLGTALTKDHARLLTQANFKTVVLILDSDNAGIKAALRSIPILTKAGLNVKVLNLQEAKDPDEYIQKFGKDTLSKLVSAANSHIIFQINLLKADHDLSATEGRVSFTTEAAKILATLQSDIEIDVYLKEVAQATNISPAAIQSEVNKQRGERTTNMPRNYTAINKQTERGVTDAKKSLLNLVLTQPQAAIALKQSAYLESDELADSTYTTLLTLAYKNAETNIEHSPADIINHFTTVEEQQAVAEIFAAPLNFLSTEKALNDMANIIKRAWLKSKKLEANDLNALKTLQLLEKNMETQYITMSDG